MVRFHQRDTGRVILATDNRGVGAGRERLHDGRLVIIGWGNSGCFNFVLLRVLPVIVRGERRSRAVVQTQIGILERADASLQSLQVDDVARDRR